MPHRRHVARTHISNASGTLRTITWLTGYSVDMVYTIEASGEPQMPWKECTPMDERLRFVARLLPSGRTRRTLTAYRHLDFLKRTGLVHRLESAQTYLPCDYPRSCSREPVPGLFVVWPRGRGGVEGARDAPFPDRRRVRVPTGQRGCRDQGVVRHLRRRRARLSASHRRKTAGTRRTTSCAVTAWVIWSAPSARRRAHGQLEGSHPPSGYPDSVPA